MNSSSARQLKISPEVAQRRHDRLIAGRVRLLRSIHESGLMQLHPDDAYRSRVDERYLSLARSDELFMATIRCALNDLSNFTPPDHVVYIQLYRLSPDTLLNSLPVIGTQILFPQSSIALVDSLVDDALCSEATRADILYKFVRNSHFYSGFSGSLEQLEGLLYLPEGITLYQYLSQMDDQINKATFRGVYIGWVNHEEKSKSQRREAILALFNEQFC